MIFFQIIAVVFGLLMMYFIRIHHLKKNIESFEYGVWLAVWIIFIYLTIFPQTVRGIAEQLHIARIFDLLVIIALMVLIVMTFTNMIAYKRIEKKLEDITRKRAIEKVSNGKNAR